MFANLLNKNCQSLENYQVTENQAPPNYLLRILFVYYSLHVYMYLCMYTCIYVCIHVFMYVYMYLCMYTCIYVFSVYRMRRRSSSLLVSERGREKSSSVDPPKRSNGTLRGSSFDGRKHSNTSHLFSLTL